jgi:hydrogenase expression/formation protein HypD
MGFSEYRKIAEDFRVPVVVGGFEPVDLLEAISMLVAQLEEGRAEVENQYSRSVDYAGNPAAQEMMRDVFEVSDRKWRGIGTIGDSGLRLRNEYAAHDAERVFHLDPLHVEEPRECISALVLQGQKKPVECTAFGKRCTPMTPLGAPMVSSEGACAAWFQYKRYA